MKWLVAKPAMRKKSTEIESFKEKKVLIMIMSPVNHQQSDMLD